MKITSSVVGTAKRFAVHFGMGQFNVIASPCTMGARIHYPERSTLGRFSRISASRLVPIRPFEDFRVSDRSAAQFKPMPCSTRFCTRSRSLPHVAVAAWPHHKAAHRGILQRLLRLSPCSGSCSVTAERTRLDLIQNRRRCDWCIR